MFVPTPSFVLSVTKQHEGLQVRKSLWTKNQMSDAAYLDEAAELSKSLTRMRARGPGDTENAMRAIERDYGVDYWLLWRLRYRRSVLKDIGISAYMRLKAAHQAECERQIRKLHNDIERTEKNARANRTVVDAAKALVGED
jgi:hypothetical protein